MVLHRTVHQVIGSYPSQPEIEHLVSEDFPIAVAWVVFYGGVDHGLSLCAAFHGPLVLALLKVTATT
jgi:hypothetical protein